MSGLTEIKPAIYRFNVNSWGWVSLCQLARLVFWGADEVEIDIVDLEKEFLRRFIDASSNGSGSQLAVFSPERRGMVTIFFDGDSLIELAVGQPFNIPLERIFVPAGFAKDVLDFVRHGAVRVELDRSLSHIHEWEEDGEGAEFDCPFRDKPIFCHFDGTVGKWFPVFAYGQDGKVIPNPLDKKGGAR